jgi:hypothetical protein
MLSGMSWTFLPLILLLLTLLPTSIFFHDCRTAGHATRRTTVTPGMSVHRLTSEKSVCINVLMTEIACPGSDVGKPPAFVGRSRTIARFAFMTLPVRKAVAAILEWASASLARASARHVLMITTARRGCAAVSLMATLSPGAFRNVPTVYVPTLSIKNAKRTVLA